MKIEKFNESYRGDKVIKLYENSIIDDYFIDKKESSDRLKNKKKKILELINEYVGYNKDYFNKKYNIYSKIESFNFYVDEDTKIPNFSIITTTISFQSTLTGKKKNYSDYDIHWLIYKDIESLLIFLKNPNIYQKTKKYNL
jgi:hypothetical protein